MTKLSTAFKLAKQDPIVLVIEVLKKVTGINLLRFYDANVKDRNTILGFDVDSINPDAFAGFIGLLLPLEARIYKPPISIVDFLGDLVVRDYVSADAVNRLDALLKKNGSDKSSQHNYQLVYQPILDFLLANNETVALTEIGIGTNNLDVVSNMGWAGVPGASLRSFRDYNPLINVIGADIDSGTLFTEDRIKTRVVDQLASETIRDLIADTQPHLLIDDGLHALRPNINVLIEYIKYAALAKNKWLVIEDLGNDESISHCWSAILEALKKYHLFKVWHVQTASCPIVVIKS